MPDVTIGDLSAGTPSTADVIPYSTGTETRKATFANVTVGTASVANNVAWTNVSNRPTNVSQFNNDSGYITAAQVPTSAPYASSQVFTSNNNFTVPSGVTSLRILCVGGGGGAKCDCGASSSTAGGTGGTSQVVFNGSKYITATGGGGGNSGVGVGTAAIVGATSSLQASNGSGSARPDLNENASTNSGFAKMLVDFISPVVGYGGSTSGCRPANGAGGALAWGIFSATPGSVLSVSVGGAGGAYAYQCTASSGTRGVVLIEW